MTTISKRQVLLNSFLIIAFLLNASSSTYIVQADETDCGEWDVNLPPSNEYRVEVREIKRSEDNCEITIRIENTTEHFFFGNYGVSYEMKKSTNNILPQFVYSKDATLILDNIPYVIIKVFRIN